MAGLVFVAVAAALIQRILDVELLNLFIENEDEEEK